MIKKLGYFYTPVIVIYFPLLAAVVWLLDKHGAEGSASSVFYGSLVSLILIAGTVSVSLKMITSSKNSLVIFVFGGMIIRMIVVLAISVLVFYLSDFKLIYFFSGLFGSYIILQVFELVYLQKRLVKRVSNERTDKSIE